MNNTAGFLWALKMFEGQNNRIKDLVKEEKKSIKAQKTTNKKNGGKKDGDTINS